METDIAPFRQRTNWILFFCALSIRQFASVTAGDIFIPKCHSEVRVPLGLPPETPVFQLDMVNLTGSDFGGGDIAIGSPKATKRPSSYSADDSFPDQTPPLGVINRKIRNLFAFNESNGSLYIKRVPAGLANIDLTAFDITIPLEVKYFEDCYVRIRFERNIDELCDMRNLPRCFSGSNVTYLIPESVPPGTPFGTVSPLLASGMCQNEPQFPIYEVVEGWNLVTVDRNSGALSLISSLDAEANFSHHFIITCTSKNLDDEYVHHSMNGTIVIVDINDNGPHLQPGQATLLYYNVTKTGPTEISLSVLDFDSRRVNNISISKSGDYLNLFRIDHDPIHHIFENVVLPNKWKVMMFFAYVYPRGAISFPGPLYIFDVIFEDQGLDRTKTHNQVKYTIQLHNITAEIKELNVTEDVYGVKKTASQFYKVAQPFLVIKESGFRFIISNSKKDGAFNITPNTGIIFVNNRDILMKYNSTFIELNVTWFIRNESSHHIFRINITEDKDKRLPCVDNLNSMCAKTNSETVCVSSCALGTPSGYCQWRDFKLAKNPTFDYGTCSSNLKDCPNKICDELEDMFPKLCPQDCATHVVGELVETSGSRGINMAMGSCFCENPDVCTCYVADQFGNNMSSSYKTSRTDLQIASSTSSQDVLEPDSHFGLYRPTELSKEPVCGPKCIMTFVIVPCLVLTVSVLLLIYMKTQRQRKQLQNSKHVNVTLSDAPTGYVDDRSLSLPDSQTLSETYCSTKCDYETKWEVQRETIIFEQTLGEGEFGKVVKAQAWGINGLQAYTTVAVKMLKSNGSSSELMDLISEFHLLKEVQHPNVIRLLGACTRKDGPLYVIVEYAELGSLKSYLRQCRHTDFDQTSQLRTIDNPSYLLNNSTVLTQQDLLSFAWQIARGMAYLSDMKLVHRDLATRNILLSSGKIVKISDFGLSRDVYEGDTYFKRSKGRVPVKWMAIESLRDHVYTSKSDVWSFGIVLWEIVTLGASPYPGLCPERLYQLLNAGYRMEKPEYCGDALYRIMRQCWSANSFERPSFKELTQKFDNMLQDTAVYLDLALFLGPSASAQECETTNSDSDEPTTPLRSSFAEETVNYGQISFASSVSSIS